MELLETPGQFALIIYTWVLFIGGIYALVLDLQADAKDRSLQLRPWNLSWLNFALGAWVLVVLVMFIQSILHLLLKAIDLGGEDNPWLLFYHGFTFQGTILLFIMYVLLRKDVHESLAISPVRFKVRQHSLLIIRSLFSGLFLLMLTSLCWAFLLQRLEDAGLVSPSPPQELVTLFANQGISLLTLLLFFVAVVMAPVAEELLFRVGLYRFLKGRFSPRVGLIVSSLLFAMMHFNTFSFLPLFLIGMLLCRVYEKSGNVLVPIIFHALFNAQNIIRLLFVDDISEALESFSN